MTKSAGTGSIRYRKSCKDLAPEQLTGFFVGWPSHPDPQTHLRILRDSYRVVLAMEGERCIGFINALSDGHLCAFIPLLEVLPEYQGRGIGSQLVRHMLDELNDLYSVDIVCDEGLKAYYESLGFTRLAGMARRNYARSGGK